MRDVRCRDGHVLGVERAVRAIDRIAHLESVHPCADRGDGARPIRAQDHWKMSVLRIARLVLCLPHSDAGGVYRDEHFARSGFPDWKLVYRERFSITTTVDGRGTHCIWHGRDLSDHPTRGGETQNGEDGWQDRSFHAS